MLATIMACPRRVPLPIPEAGEAPLERALRALERTPDDLVLPRASEAGYSLLTSYSAIDQALASPLSLGPRAESLGVALDAAHSPAEILRSTQDFLPGATTPSTTSTESKSPESPPSAPQETPSEVIRSEAGKLLLGHLPETFREALEDLVALIEHNATSLNTCSKSGSLRPPPIAAEEFFLERWAGQPRYRSHPTGMQEDFMRYAGDIDLTCIQTTGEMLLEGLNSQLPALRSAAEELPEAGGAVIQLETSFGPLLIGSRGPDVYGLDAFMTLDPGGDDLWTAGAGSNLGLPSPLSLALDLGGNDRYACERVHCQGSGYGGVGVLVDLGEGNDSYFAGSQSQGAGFLGLGVLWDEAGNDTYEADSFGQGAGTLGVGLLLDSAGSDSALLRARGQGFAATGGAGLFVDLAGNDRRRIGLSAESPHGPLAGGGQGAAWGTRSLPWRGAPSFHGGVGLLYDRGGNDTYYARAYGQGSAWMLSLGMLLDRAGNDHYVAEWFGQGAAQHLAAGILLDGGGNDLYEGANTVQASALDRSVGALWDRGEGDDVYRVGQVGSSLSREVGAGQAWAGQANALAVLVDAGGDDTYQAAGGGIAYAIPPSRPDRSPLAFLVDLDGSDNYVLGRSRSGGSPAEGATWLQPGSAVGMDTRSARPGWLPVPDDQPKPRGFFYLEPSETNDDSSGLPAGDLNGDSTQRWAALEALYRSRLNPTKEADDLDLEHIRTLAAGDRSPPVRRAAARLLVSHGVREGLDILVDSLAFRSEDTRRPSALSSLPYWLSVATGIPEYSTVAEWKATWRSMAEGFETELAWDRVQALDALLLASGRGDTAKLRSICEEVRDLNMGELRPACAQVVGFWAWTLGHPESGARSNLLLAVELGQLAISLAPSEAEHFTNLARALYARGEQDLALRAVEKSTILDPDALPLQALRRQIEDGIGN